MEETHASSFAKLWTDSEEKVETLSKNHNYTVGELGKENTSPEFVRLDKFLGAEPNREPVFEGPLPKFLGYDEEGNVLSEHAMPELTHTRTSTEERSFCGSSLSSRRAERDEWKEWQRVKNDKLLGGDRIERTGRGYTVFPGDPAVNAAILGAANKLIPARIVDGLPCEEFRDLCSHLAMYGTRTFADGTVSTFYLTDEATAYIRKTLAPQSLSSDAAAGRFFANDNNPTKGTP